MSKKKKIALPTDREGTPISVGDVVMWMDGTVFRVEVLEYYGPQKEGIGWVLCGKMDGKETFSVNPSAGLVLDKRVFGGSDD